MNRRALRGCSGELGSGPSATGGGVLRRVSEPPARPTKYKAIGTGTRGSTTREIIGVRLYKVAYFGLGLSLYHYRTALGFLLPNSHFLLNRFKMAELTLRNSIREKMLKDEVAYTLSVKLVRSIELPMMAKTAGFDGILIDMEHSSFDLDTTGTA